MSNDKNAILEKTDAVGPNPNSNTTALLNLSRFRMAGHCNVFQVHFTVVYHYIRVNLISSRDLCQVLLFSRIIWHGHGGHESRYIALSDN